MQMKREKNKRLFSGIPRTQGTTPDAVTVDCLSYFALTFSGRSFFDRNIDAWK